VTDFAALRDDVAAPLISANGQSGLLREASKGTYNPVTGAYDGAGAPTDTAFKFVDLPVSRNNLRSLFREELINEIDKILLMSAAELAAASKTLTVDAIIVIDGVEYRIRGFSPVAPSGVVVIYKVGVTKA